MNGAVALLESLKGQQSLHEQKSGTYERQQLYKVSVIRVEVAKTTRCCIEAVTARETPVSAFIKSSLLLTPTMLATSFATSPPADPSTLSRDLKIASAALLIPYALYASRVTEPKRRAWLLTLITASTCGPLALGVVLAHVWPTFDAAAQFTDAPAATFACRFFVTFLVLDCAVGALHYRKQFHVFEGWIHHTAYTLFFAWGLAQNASVGFASTLAMEIPTALLALGKCFPACRLDLPYGVSFAAFRVGLNLYLLAQWYAAGLFLWPCAVATLALHSHWFYRWCKSYGRRGAKDEAPSNPL